MNTMKIDLKVINEFIERRRLDGFAKSTIERDSKLLNTFYYWMKDKSYENLDYNVIDNYINSLHCSKQLLNSTRCVLYKLYNYLLYGEYPIVTKETEKIKINSAYNNYFSDYIDSIINKFDWTTINNKKVFLKHFFNYLEEKQITNLCYLKQYNITEFLNSCIPKYSKAYFNKIGYFVREYINYLYNRGIINFTGNDVIPKLNTCYSTSIPTTYSVDEIKIVLNSIDKTTKIGKRDYLIMLLLAFYGIRIGDICNMKIKCFNFELNKLIFIQKKTGKLLELPLIDEIKYAYIDYLKNSRQKCESEFLFITYKKPFRKYDKRGLRDVVPKYLKLANINTEGKKRGAHSMRHSLASNMLSNGSDIKHISDILGHNYISTSNLYLTIDIRNLQELSLELPEKLTNEGDSNE